MKLLKQLYKIHSPSGKEKKLTQFIKQYIKANMPKVTIVTDKIGNMYITKGQNETYPCIVAHLDQVQRIHSKDFTAIETEEIIFGYSPSNRQYEGLGADDKNGIWIALKCLEKYDCLKIAFFVQEEVGCIGSSQADLSFFDNCRYIIQPDRRGHNDLVTSICWMPLCSKDFIKDIKPHKFNYIETEGMTTDVGELKSRGLEISCINLSCGYYEPHTDQEFTVKKDILNCLAFVEQIIEKSQKVYFHTSEDYHKDEIYDDQRYEEIEDLTQVIIDETFINPDVTSEELWRQYHNQFKRLEESDFEEILDTINQQYYEIDDYQKMADFTDPKYKAY